MNYQKIAQNWRSGQDAEHRRETGVVLLWDGTVYGWKDKLRDARHERPGAVAVDADGSVFVAEGGNDYDGASCWVVFDPTSC